MESSHTCLYGHFFTPNFLDTRLTIVSLIPSWSAAVCSGRWNRALKSSSVIDATREWRARARSLSADMPSPFRIFRLVWVCRPDERVGNE